MTTVLFADHDYPDIELERALFDEAGVDVVPAQCRTEDEVIEHGGGCRAILLQYAPITDRVLAASPYLATVRASLEAAGVAPTIYDEVAVEPSTASFKAAAAFASEGKFDGYVSVGGGCCC